MSLTLKIIIPLFLVGMLLLMINRCNDKPPQKAKTAAKANLHQAAKPIAQYKDSSGDDHLQIFANAGQILESELKDTAVTNRTFVDTAAKNMKIKADQIQELTRENLQLKAENVQLKQKGAASDSVYYYADRWLELYYYEKMHIADVTYNVNLTSGKFTPASWLPFSHKPPVLDFSADDPRATINSVQHFTAIIPEPFIGFSADIKGTYLFNTGQILPSVGANLRLGRIHIEDRAYYDQKVKQALGISYDLFRINP